MRNQVVRRGAELCVQVGSQCVDYLTVGSPKIRRLRLLPLGRFPHHEDYSRKIQIRSTTSKKYTFYKKNRHDANPRVRPNATKGR